MNASGICVMDLADDMSVKSLMFHAYDIRKKWCKNIKNMNITCVGTKYAKMTIYRREIIANEIIHNFTEGVKHVAFEDFAYGEAGESSSVFQLAEFIGSTRRTFYDRGIPIDRYSATAVKAFATGNGSAGKYMMMLAFQRRYPALWLPEIESELKLDDSPQTDIVDAFWMAEVLRCRLAIEKGIQLDPVLEKHMREPASKGSLPLLESPRELPNS